MKKSIIVAITGVTLFFGGQALNASTSTTAEQQQIAKLDALVKQQMSQTAHLNALVARQNQQIDMLTAKQQEMRSEIQWLKDHRHAEDGSAVHESFWDNK